ncbi:unnamed protein product [Chironomus riparius]|uniref:Uncharacterized protein n=1 Tax=Chironomus riparius TaxID=315576 RepID=A0A9N9S7P9_9DIPT|nr:unnamed protein product [Chironomus riparius]
MKLILLFLTAAVSAINNEEKTLTDWYMDSLRTIQNIKSDDVFYEPTRKLNLRCISQNIGYNRHQEKTLNFVESAILIYGSGLKCLDTTKQNKVWSLLADRLVENFFYETASKDLSCFKMELKRLDSSSKYVNDFDEQSMTISSESCEDIVDMIGVDLQLSVLEGVYGDLGTLTDGELDADKFKNILLSLVVLREEASRKAEVIKELRKFLDVAIDVVKNKFTRNY